MTSGPARSAGVASVDFRTRTKYPLASIQSFLRGEPLGSVIKKRRKKMRKHKKRKLLRRARHKRKR